MRSVPFRQVLTDVAQWDDGSQADEILPGTAATAAVMINSALAMAWDYYDWPESVLCEPRTPVNRLIEYAQMDKPVIGEPFDVYSSDPYAVAGRAKPLPWTQNANGILLMKEGTGDVWLEYQRQAPVFTSAPWDAAKAYVTGELVFDDVRTGATGECYRARSNVSAGTVPTDASKWELMQFPNVLWQAVVQGAVAGMKNADAEHGTAKVKLSDMEDILEQKVLNSTDRSGRVRKLKRYR